MAAFTLSNTDGIAHLRFSRPEASNAMGAAFWADFLPAIKALDETGETRVLVISAEGKHFCAGMDLMAFAGGVPTTDTPESRASFPLLVAHLQAVLGALEAARFPVIAAIQGACIGGGLDLAAACDLRITSAEAYFRIEETNIGMMADLGSLQRLPRQMPEAMVREMAYLGKTLSAERAYAAGFVTEIVPDADAALATAMQAATRIAQRAPLAVSASKAAITYARDHNIADGLAWAGMMQSMIWNPADIQKAMTARAKRAPADFDNLAAFPHFKP